MVMPVMIINSGVLGGHDLSEGIILVISEKVFDDQHERRAFVRTESGGDTAIVRNQNLHRYRIVGCQYVVLERPVVIFGAFQACRRLISRLSDVEAPTS